MAYTPFTAINNSRDFRNQYLRKRFSVWVQRLGARYQKRQELAKSLALSVVALDPSVNQREIIDQVRSEQNFGVDNYEYQTVRPRNAA
jgi:translation elongation factor EF-Ts